MVGDATSPSDSSPRFTERDEMSGDGASCGAVHDIGEDRDGYPIEVRCQRPRGHAAPHRNRDPDPPADSYEWWPEKWWSEDDD